MKSIIPIDETWTVDLFERQHEHGREILRNNNLPYGRTLFAPLYIQQEAYQDDAITWVIDATQPGHTEYPYNEVNHVNAIVQHLNDWAVAYAIAMLDEGGWTRYAITQTVKGALLVPELLVTERESVEDALRREIITLANAAVPGVLTRIRNLLAPRGEVDIVPGVTNDGLAVSTDWFWKPTGDVMFGIEGQSPMEIPCWPDSVKDSTSATWSQEMTTYQHYEPKNTYKGSGPRTVSCTFKLHRAMWNGNQDSGNAERLVAYMESACYPDYDTQAAEPPRALLTIGKSIRIRGIMTSFDKTYQGPIGPDNAYDEILINISITEVSDNVLSTSAVRGGLAGWR